MLKTAEDLGIDPDAMAHKCADFSEFYAKHLISGTEDRQALIEKVFSHFTEKERAYMSINWLHDRTMEVIKQQMKERFERAKAESNSVSNDTGV